LKFIIKWRIDHIFACCHKYEYEQTNKQTSE
jgi:hypothetical protein